jgi:hypothetical protein
VQGGFFFHPSDKDPSLGTPDGKKPLEGGASGLQQLWNRYSQPIAFRDGGRY